MSEADEQKVVPAIDKELEEKSETRDENVSEEASSEQTRRPQSQAPAPQVRERRRRTTGGGHVSTYLQPLEPILKSTYGISQQLLGVSQPYQEISQPSDGSSQPINIPRRGRSQVTPQVVRPQARLDDRFASPKSQASSGTGSESPDQESQLKSYEEEPLFSFDDPESELSLEQEARSNPNQPSAQRPVTQHEEDLKGDDDKDDCPIPPRR